MKYEDKQVNELLKEYSAQNTKHSQQEYEEEIRAEADLCHECCSCCRVCVI